MFGNRALGADDGSLGLEQVLAGFDDQRVCAAGQQPGRVALVGVPQVGECDVTERGQLGARADRAEYPAKLTVSGGVVGCLARYCRTGQR